MGGSENNQADTPVDSDFSDRLNAFKKIERGIFGKGKANIINDLDIPALRLADSHKRVMGFWIITWISLVKDSLRKFFKNGGEMQLVIGIPFSSESYDALIKSAASSNQTLKDSLRNEFFDLLDNPRHWLDTNASELFIRMIASGQLQIRLLPDRGKEEKNSAEHSKQRIYICEGEVYSLSGSANDTWTGLKGLKEHSGPPSVSWSPDKFHSQTAITSPTLFKEDWDHQHALELEQSVIPKLEQLKQKYIVENDNQDSDYPTVFKDIENNVKKLQHSNKKAIFFHSSEAHFVNKIKADLPDEFHPEMVEFISINDDENGDELFVYAMHCSQRNVQACTFANSDQTNHIANNQLRSLTSIISIHSQDEFEQMGWDYLQSNELPKSNYIWSGIFLSLGIEVPEQAPTIPEPTPSTTIHLWDDGIFQYPYDTEPGDLEPCDHQLNALNKWKDNNYRGILQHATGTYKTATGLCAAAHLLSKEDCNFVVISSPYTEVSKQWLKLAKNCFKGVIIVPCWGTDYPEWRKDFRTAIAGALRHKRKVLAIFVNPSLWGTKNQTKHAIEQLNLLSSNNQSWGLVADEMHNWISGSPSSTALNFMNEVTDGCSFRLGLSAKIDKRGEADYPQNIFVRDWFAFNLATSKRMIDDLTLKTAIEEGFLRKYDYQIVPIYVNISDDYVGKHGQQASIEYAFKVFEEEIHKYVAKHSFRLVQEEANRLLIYIGPTKKIATEIVEKINANRGNFDSSFVRKFTSDENSKERAEILDDFKHSVVKILVAIRCLDEGVNLPIADCAIMAMNSEDDDREWIQRRGRILRRIDGESTIAKIIDFYPVFRVNDKSVLFHLHNFQSEQFTRMQEFSTTATFNSRQEMVQTFKDIKE